MANYKRKKSKRNVRCTLCTTDRWKGNSAERHRHGSTKKAIVAKEKIVDQYKEM